MAATTVAAMDPGSGVAAEVALVAAEGWETCTVEAEAEAKTA